MPGNKPTAASAIGQAILWLNLGTAIFVGFGTGSVLLGLAALSFSCLITLLSILG